MAYRFCPVPCITKRKSKPNSKVSSDADMSSMVWEALNPMVFCSDVFPRNSIRKEEPTDISNTCWYCHVDDNICGKFIAKKSSDPVPDEIRHVQEQLGFITGEPLTKKNFHKILLIGKRKCKDDRNSESTSQAKAITPLQIESSNGQSSLKRRFEKRDDPPLKKYVCDRHGNTVPKDAAGYRTSEYTGMKSGFGPRSVGLASV